MLNLNVSAFHGFRPYRRQIRATVAKLIPRWSANNRADQCVTPSLAGGGSSVAAMITCSRHATVVVPPEGDQGLSIDVIDVESLVLLEASSERHREGGPLWRCGFSSSS